MSFPEREKTQASELFRTIFAATKIGVVGGRPKNPEVSPVSAYVYGEPTHPIPVLHPDRLQRGMTCFIAVRDVDLGLKRTVTRILGPFMFLEKLGKLPSGLPTEGHEQLLVLGMGSSCRQTRRLIAPKDGQNLIFGKLYSLHIATREYLMRFSLSEIESRHGWVNISSTYY